jgi:hypothetical protein
MTHSHAAACYIIRCVSWLHRQLLPTPTVNAYQLTQQDFSNHKMHAAAYMLLPASDLPLPAPTQTEAAAIAGARLLVAQRPTAPTTAFGVPGNLGPLISAAPAAASPTVKTSWKSRDQSTRQLPLLTMC